MIWRVVNIILTTLLVIAVIFLLYLNVQVFTKSRIPPPVPQIVHATSTVSTITEITTLPLLTIASSTKLFEYIEVTESCGPYFESACLRVRSGPGEEYPIVGYFRKGTVLRVSGSVQGENHLWYKVVYNEWLRYPERVSTDLYVVSDYVTPFLNQGVQIASAKKPATTTKRILVDRSDQTLYAYDGEDLLMEVKISTGTDLTPTPDGTFTIFKKTPTRYMQGPLPGVSDDPYDLPGVPWDMYFTADGAVIHGAYWHDRFGHPMSHGCVNMPPDKAKELYGWAGLGTPVTVQE